MQMQAYLTESGRTMAKGFHDELLDAESFWDVLTTAQLVISPLSASKRALFYGKDSDTLDYYRDVQTDMGWQHQDPDLTHGIVGVATESAELLELLSEAIVNQKEIPANKLVDECGDVLWYLALLFRKLGVSFEEVAGKNIEKLKVRFPEKFTENLALNRDKAAEDTVF